MIISHRHRFVFVHIPKCAGTTVRTQLARCDPEHVSLQDSGTHPVLGQIDFGHIPLPVLRVHFPRYHASLADYPAFAVLRERALRILDAVAAEPDTPPARLIYFARQADFVFDGNTRLVEHLIPLDLVPEFLGYMGRRTGVALVTTARSNRNVELRFKRLGPLAFRVNDRLRRVLPSDFYGRLKTAALRLVARSGGAAEASGVLDLPEVRDFVATHYAGDARLYAEVVARRDALRTALRGDTLEKPPS